MPMLFTKRDRERLEAVDRLATGLSKDLPYVAEQIKEHVKWCSKLQWTQLVLLLGVVGFLVKIVLKLG